jgi:hypothetical protein
LRAWRAHAGAAGGIDAVLESGEGVGVKGEGLSERELLRVAVFVLVLVSPHLGLGFVEAAEDPLTADEVVDETAGIGGGGAVLLVVVFDELLEVGAVFVGEGEGFGVDAGSESVHGGGGLARDRDGAAGFLGVTTVGFYLAKGGHGGSGSELRSDAQGRALCHFYDRGWISGNRG